MGFNDHGQKHIEIVIKNALTMFNILKSRGVYSNIIKHYAKNPFVKNYGFSHDDSEVIIFLAACTHDIGHAVSRKDHHFHSTYLALPLLEEILDDIYQEEQRTIITSEILHCLATNYAKKKPLTLEASILRVADALDMAAGRARIAFKSNAVIPGKKKGEFTIITTDEKPVIHQTSSLGIKEIIIKPAQEKPILIEILVVDSSAIFQIDELLRKKIRGTGLEKYIQLIIRRVPGKTHQFKKINFKI